LLKHYNTSRIVISLRTKNKTVAKRGASTIASRFDDYWMSLRIAELNIPLPIASSPASELQAAVKLTQLKRQGTFRVGEMPSIPGIWQSSIIGTSTSSNKMSKKRITNQARIDQGE